MQENTNKAIAINSIILYVKMGITTICALLTTRFALQALGVVDFGLYSVLGGIISFMGIFNTIMLSTSNRYLAVAIGKGDVGEINKVFNVNLSIFLAIAVLMLVVSLPVGWWYIHRYVNYDGDINNALMVFYVSIIGSILSAVGTPYNGLLMAKERFIVFSGVEVISHIIRLVVAWLLISHFSSKLLIYTITLAAMTALPTFVYWWYCKRKFPEMVCWHFVKDKSLYKEIFGFSGWVAYGAVACVAKSQGAALLVNAFFNTVMNTALGLASSIGSYVGIFAQNVTQPMAPQITKSYAAGNRERTDALLIMSTKFSFMLMLLVGAPFLVGAEWLLKLWLGEVPPYAVSFTILIIVDHVATSFNSGISNLIFASGKIKLYQVLINTLRLVAIVAGYFVLKSGAQPEALLITYIVFSLIIVVSTQWVLHKTLGYDNMILVKKSYIPSLCILALFVPLCFIHIDIHPLLYITIAVLYLAALEFFIGFNKSERERFFAFATSKLKRSRNIHDEK